MAEHAVSTLAPDKPVPSALDPEPKPTLVPAANSETQALFDSIAHEESDSAPEGKAPFRNFFAGLLWFGYAVAIVVALAIIWSAANGLLGSLPR